MYYAAFISVISSFLNDEDNLLLHMVNKHALVTTRAKEYRGGCLSTRMNLFKLNDLYNHSLQPFDYFLHRISHLQLYDWQWVQILSTTCTEQEQKIDNDGGDDDEENMVVALRLLQRNCVNLRIDWKKLNWQHVQQMLVSHPNVFFSGHIQCLEFHQFHTNFIVHMNMWWRVFPKCTSLIAPHAIVILDEMEEENHRRYNDNDDPYLIHVECSRLYIEDGYKYTDRLIDLGMYLKQTTIFNWNWPASLIKLSLTDLDCTLNGGNNHSTNNSSNVSSLFNTIVLPINLQYLKIHGRDNSNNNNSSTSPSPSYSSFLQHLHFDVACKLQYLSCNHYDSEVLDLIYRIPHLEGLQQLHLYGDCIPISQSANRYTAYEYNGLVQLLTKTTRLQSLTLLISFRVGQLIFMFDPHQRKPEQDMIWLHVGKWPSSLRELTVSCWTENVQDICADCTDLEKLTFENLEHDLGHLSYYMVNTILKYHQQQEVEEEEETEDEMDDQKYEQGDLNVNSMDAIFCWDDDLVVEKSVEKEMSKQEEQEEDQQFNWCRVPRRCSVKNLILSNCTFINRPLFPFMGLLKNITLEGCSVRLVEQFLKHICLRSWKGYNKCYEYLNIHTLILKNIRFSVHVSKLLQYFQQLKVLKWTTDTEIDSSIYAMESHIPLTLHRLCVSMVTQHALCKMISQFYYFQKRRLAYSVGEHVFNNKKNHTKKARFFIADIQCAKSTAHNDNYNRQSYIQSLIEKELYKNQALELTINENKVFGHYVLNEQVQKTIMISSNGQRILFTS